MQQASQRTLADVREIYNASDGSVCSVGSIEETVELFERMGKNARNASKVIYNVLKRTRLCEREAT